MAVMGRVVAVLAALCLLASGGRADEPPKEVRLTEAQIFKYIESLASPAGPEINRIVGQLMAAGETSTDAAAQKEIMRRLAAAQDDFARSVGFDTYREYADVGHTYSLLVARESSPDVSSGAWEAEVNKAIAEIEANAAMGEAEKKELIASMRAVVATMKQPRIPENVELYRRLKPRIDEVTAAVDRILAARSVTGPPTGSAK